MFTKSFNWRNVVAIAICLAGMKKYLSVWPLIMALVMAVTACGSMRKAQKSVEPEPVAVAAPETTTEWIISNKMDRQIADLEKMDGVLIETVSDANNLKVIKVTFTEGILFATGSSALSQASRNWLTGFARSLANNPQTDVGIHGHTDNTGTREVNVKLSADRAGSVAGFLTGQGIASNRITTQGHAFDSPVADNSTAEGRTRNRRVEVFVSANEEMIEQAKVTAETARKEQAASTASNPPATASQSSGQSAKSSATSSSTASGSSKAAPASQSSTASGSSKAQKSATGGPTAFSKGDNVVGIGAGFGNTLYSGYRYYSGYRPWPTLSLYYENCIIDNLFDAKSAIGVGGMVGYSTASWKYKGSGDPYGWRSNNIFFGARAAFHYSFIPKLDVYTGFMAGYNVHSWKWTGEYGDYVSHRYGSNGFIWSWFAGARYYFAPAIAIFGEGGYGLSTLNAGISFKF